MSSKKDKEGIAFLSSPIGEEEVILISTIK
jgi:hypothetical protein